MENKLPTAEEFYDKSKHDSILDIMIEFAKIHCIEQAKVIAKNAKIKKGELVQEGEREVEIAYKKELVPVWFQNPDYIDESSILDAYNLDNIK